MTHNNYFLCTLEGYEDLAPNVRHFTFASDKPTVFLPGQFITLYWEEEGKTIHRNYSLANYGGYNPAYTNRLELATSYVPQGFASERMFTMRKGDQLQGSGPYGKLILRDEPVKRYLLVATGTGITPYRTMLTKLADRINADPKLRILLLFGIRYESNLLYKSDLLNFAAQHSQFSLQIYCSRTADPQEPHIQTGYVTQALSDQLIINPAEDIAYLCGNPNMIDDVRRILLEKGLPTNRIRQERYTSPKQRIS